MELNTFGYKVFLVKNRGRIRYCKICDKKISIGDEYNLIWSSQYCVIFDNLFFLCLEHGKEFANKYSIKIEEYYYECT